MYQEKRAFELLEKLAFVRTAGTRQEAQAAQILAAELESFGVEAQIVPFEIQDAKEPRASLKVVAPYEKTYAVTGYKCGKSTPQGGLRAPLVYAENLHEANLVDAQGKILLVNTRVTAEIYQKIVQSGAAGFISMSGSMLDEPDRTDLDTRKLREPLLRHGDMTGVHIRIADAFEMVARGAREVEVTLENENETRTSQNVVVRMEGSKYPQQVVSFGAHYDSVPFSTGVYDNGAGSVILMELARWFAKNPPLRTVEICWYGSEEIGLMGSKAYVSQLDEQQLKQRVLMVNVDVAAPVLGHDTAIVTGAESFAHFTDYWMKMGGYPVTVKQDIYSSDCIPFADKGIPTISFCRFGAQGAAFIHGRNDVMAYLSQQGLACTLRHVLPFSDALVRAAVFPVEREMPGEIVEKIDRYLFKQDLKQA